MGAKKPYKHRFQYFKQALIVRAAAIGINLEQRGDGRVAGSSVNFSPMPDGNNKHD